VGTSEDAGRGGGSDRAFGSVTSRQLVEKATSIATALNHVFVAIACLRFSGCLFGRAKKQLGK
jgi:hypothetical protein